MTIVQQITHQIRTYWPTLLAVTLVTGALLGLVEYLHQRYDLWIGNLMRDPNAVGHQPYYAGFFSQCGGLFWAAGATVCFGTRALLRRGGGGGRAAAFFLAAGLLTLLLGVDDVFMIHEEAAPGWGLPERVVYLAYGLLTLAFLVGFSRYILTRTPYLLLLIALGCFATSVGLDSMHLTRIDPFFLEDGAKLAGILSWLGYFVGAAGVSLRS